MKENGPILPHHLYGEVAPLCIPLAQHLLTRMWKSTGSEGPDLLDQFLNNVATMRKYAFTAMDVFVRNRDKTRRDEEKLSSGWLRERLAIDGEGQIPVSTFNDWMLKNAIRMERKGRPHPDWAEALLIARMIDRGRNVVPDTIKKEEPPWWCYAQSPGEKPSVVPLNDIEKMSRGSILWTPHAGAAWNHPYWNIVGAGGDFVGAIRFQGVKHVWDDWYWDVSLEDVQAWNAKLAAQVIPSEINMEDQIQDIANLVLDQLALTRLHV